MENNNKAKRKKSKKFDSANNKYNSTILQLCSSNKSETISNSSNVFQCLRKSNRNSTTSSIGFVGNRPSSVSSLASICHITKSGKFTSITTIEDLTHEKLGVLNKYGQNLYDTIVIYLTCPIHKKVAITHIQDRGPFLPHGTIRSGQSWSNACLSLINKILPNLPVDSRETFIKDPILIDLLRVQIPIYLDFITRVVYHAMLTQEGCRKKYCEDTALLQWNIIETILEDSKLNILGPEPKIFNNLTIQCREMTLFTVLGTLLSSKESSDISMLVNSVNYKESDLIKIYSDFLQHTFPSEYMSLSSFREYFKKLDYQFESSVDWRIMFKSFANDGKKFLNFHNFLIGIIMLDRFLIDKSTDKSNIRKSIRTIKKKCRSARKNSNSKSNSFNKMIDTKKFYKNAGKWVLTSPLKCYKNKQAYSSLDFKRLVGDANKDMNKFKFEKLTRENCSRCGHREYSIAQHVMTVQQSASLSYPIVIPPEEIKNSLPLDKNLRKLSTRVFLKNFVCNQILEIIRSYAQKQKIYPYPLISESELIWDNLTDREKIMEKIRQILSIAQTEYSEYGRVLINVASPCYVIGDIHGNLHDLLLYEQTLWKFGVHVSPTNFLFLGDIVDRGSFSIECALYLICLKLMSPNKIYILRGNHESRSVQKEYTFEKECHTKFGPDNGAELFELFNNVFDLWPLAAVIDDSIFCAHGGIPSGAIKIEHINAIQLPLKDPDNDALANEILWNDPLSADEFKALLEENDLLSKTPSEVQTSSKGFIFNKKRGTANYFSDEALDIFLTVNGFSHLIRAHELIQSGYQFMFGGRCITIFSCAKYCDGVNEAAVALVTGNKIRIIKVDKNAS